MWLQWTITTDFIVHHREPSCTIVKFFYNLANLRHYYMVAHKGQRYKSCTKKRAKTINNGLYLKSTQKEKALIMNALRDIL